jgi:Nif-specific regulatory protein
MDRDKACGKENVLEHFLSDCEKIVIMHVLTKTKGNQSAAARLLGTTKHVLIHKIHKYGIDYEQYK